MTKKRPRRMSEKKLCCAMLVIVYLEDVCTHYNEHKKLGFLFPEDTYGKRYLNISYKGYKYKIILCGKRGNHFWKVRPHRHKVYKVEYADNEFDKVTESIRKYHKMYIEKCKKDELEADKCF